MDSSQLVKSVFHWSHIQQGLEKPPFGREKPWESSSLFSKLEFPWWFWREGEGRGTACGLSPRMMKRTITSLIVGQVWGGGGGKRRRWGMCLFLNSCAPENALSFSHVNLHCFSQKPESTLKCKVLFPSGANHGTELPIFLCYKPSHGGDNSINKKACLSNAARNMDLGGSIPAPIAVSKERGGDEIRSNSPATTYNLSDAARGIQSQGLFQPLLKAMLRLPSWVELLLSIFS